MKYVVFSISLYSHSPPYTLCSSFYSTKAPLCTLQVEYSAKKTSTGEFITQRSNSTMMEQLPDECRQSTAFSISMETGSN